MAPVNKNRSKPTAAVGCFCGFVVRRVRFLAFCVHIPCKPCRFEGFLSRFASESCRFASDATECDLSQVVGFGLLGSRKYKKALTGQMVERQMGWGFGAGLFRGKSWLGYRSARPAQTENREGGCRLHLKCTWHGTAIAGRQSPPLPASPQGELHSFTGYPQGVGMGIE